MRITLRKVDQKVAELTRRGIKEVRRVSKDEHEIPRAHVVLGAPDYTCAHNASIVPMCAGDEAIKYRFSVP